MKKIILLVGLIAVLGGGVVGSVRAAEFKAADPEGNGNLVLSTKDTYTNLYTAGGSVTVNSTVNGDLYVAGGTISVDGSVEEDLNFAGGNVSVGAPVGGDIHGAAGDIVISGIVTGDVVVAGGTVTIRDSAEIDGDLIVAGGNVTVDGPISGKIAMRGGTLTLNSVVSGDVNAKVDSLSFGEGADIAGTVTYASAKDAVIAEGAQVPHVVKLPATATKSGDAKGWFVALLFGLLTKFIATVIALLVLVRVAGLKTASTLSLVHAQTGRQLLLGAVAIVITPIACLLLFITVVGYYLAFVVVACYLLMLALSGLIAALFVGQWAMKQLQKDVQPGLDFKTIVLGAALLMIIGLVPFVGWLVAFGLVAIGFGGLVTLLQQELMGSAQ